MLMNSSGDQDTAVAQETESSFQRRAVRLKKWCLSTDGLGTVRSYGCRVVETSAKRLRYQIPSNPARNSDGL
jgi:hypothetical protein